MARFIILVLSLTGCVNECDEGVSRCAGTSSQSCRWHGDGPGSHLEWDSLPCRVACAMTSQGARCVDSSDPVPECQRDGYTCWNGGPTQCVGGFPTGSTPCDAGMKCVEALSCGAICAVSAQPDSHCGPEKTSDGFDPSPGSLCDNGTLAACNCGYIVWRESCGASDRCRAFGAQASCTLSSSPDARCPDQTANSGFCDGNIAMSCWHGYTTATQDCSAGTCVINQFGAGCQYSIQPG